MDQKTTICEILPNYSVKILDITNSSNPLNIPPILIINLKTDSYRRSYMKFIMKKLNLNYKLIIVDILTKDVTMKLQKYMAKQFSIPEMGCCLSHLWCLNYCIQQNYNKFLILEDDVIFHRYFLQLFPKYLRMKFDLLQLGACDFNYHTNVSKLNTTTNVYYPKLNALGAHANLYSLEFAKIFMEHKMENFSGFDADYKVFYDKYKIGICCPNLVVCELSTTSLGHNFSPFSSQQNSYFMSKCFENFSYSDYNFMWIYFIRTLHPLAKKHKIQNMNTEEIIELFKKTKTDNLRSNSYIPIDDIVKYTTYTGRDLQEIFDLIDADNDYM